MHTKKFRFSSKRKVISRKTKENELRIRKTFIKSCENEKKNIHLGTNIL